MKNFMIISATAMVTIMVVIGGIVALMFNEGILTIERRDVNHTKTVMVDGVVTEERNWNEVLGYEVKIDVVDGAYIGK